MEWGNVTAKCRRLLRFSLLELWIHHMLCKMMLLNKWLRFVCEKLYEKKYNPILSFQSILSVRRLDLHDKNNQICASDRWLLMVSGTNWFSQLMLMHYPQLSNHTLASESINYILIEKEISSTIMLLHQLILFQQRNVVCWKYTITDRESLIQWLVLPYHTT